MKKEKMKLLCDLRERNSTLPHFPKAEWIVETTLHTGDYAVAEGEKLYYVFERKTWADLAASLKDGRASSQMEKLRKMPCPVYLIIEGKMSFQPDHLIGGIEFYKLQAYITNALIMGVPYVQTKDKFHTVDFLVRFTEMFMKSEGRGKSGGLAEITEKKKKTVAEQAEAVWRAFPGCSSAAFGVLKNYPVVKVLAMPAEDIAKMKYLTGRSFGAKMAEKILSVFEKEEVAVKVLSAVNGISKDCAKYILAQVSFWEFIMDGKMDVAASDKKNLGPVMQNRIWEIFNYSLN
jgi:ERCC4-type nuclease